MFYLVPNTRQKLVPDCMTHVRETGTSFLVPVSGQYVMGIRTETQEKHKLNRKHKNAVGAEYIYSSSYKYMRSSGFFIIEVYNIQRMITNYH